MHCIGGGHALKRRAVCSAWSVFTWAELMKDIGKVKLTIQPQKKSLQKVWEWLEKYVAPSLKLFAEVGKIEQRDYIGNLVANGEMNITQKQLYDDYIKARRLEERG